jgi:hypothetical protein
MEVPLQEDPMCGTTRCKGLDKIIAIGPGGTVAETHREGPTKRTMMYEVKIP